MAKTLQQQINDAKKRIDNKKKEGEKRRRNLQQKRELKSLKRQEKLAPLSNRVSFAREQFKPLGKTAKSAGKVGVGVLNRAANVYIDAGLVDVPKKRKMSSKRRKRR